MYSRHGWVGAKEGVNVGELDGASVGVSVGLNVGIRVGGPVTGAGPLVGTSVVGMSVEVVDGEAVGANVAPFFFICSPCAGVTEGVMLGEAEGTRVGLAVAAADSLQARLH